MPFTPIHVGIAMPVKAVSDQEIQPVDLCRGTGRDGYTAAGGDAHGPGQVAWLVSHLFGRGGPGRGDGCCREVCARGAYQAVPLGQAGEGCHLLEGGHLERALWDLQPCAAGRPDLP